MRVFKTPAELEDAVGADLGESDWLIIDQDRIMDLPMSPAITNGSMSTRRRRSPAPMDRRSRTAT